MPLTPDDLTDLDDNLPLPEEPVDAPPIAVPLNPHHMNKSSDQLMAELERAGVDLRVPSSRVGLPENVRRKLMTDAELNDSATRAARMRSHRSAYMRKIDKQFNLYEPFTVEECARRTKTRPEELEKYLIAEAAMVATKINLGPEPGTYMLTSPFD